MKKSAVYVQKKKSYKGFGNNAQPINDGECCDKCNATVVVPKRLEIAFGTKNNKERNTGVVIMGKPMQRKYKNKVNVTCENCINCMYEEHGDMYCDEHEDFAYVYEQFCPTEDYMWCNQKLFKER